MLAEIAMIVLLDEATANSIIQSVYQRATQTGKLSTEQFEQLIRATLIGRTNGPKLGKILSILGKQRSLERIGAALIR